MTGGGRCSTTWARLSFRWRQHIPTTRPSRGFWATITSCCSIGRNCERLTQSRRRKKKAPLEAGLSSFDAGFSGSVARDHRAAEVIVDLDVDHVRILADVLVAGVDADRRDDAGQSVIVGAHEQVV